MRTAFSEVPKKCPIFNVCFTHLKNSSIAQRRLYRSAISCALAVRSLVKMRNTLPVSITTQISRTRSDIGLCREAASRFGRYPIRSLRIDDDPAGTGRFSTTSKGVLPLSRVTMWQLRPPAIIVITEVENVGCARLNRHLLRCRDIIYVRRGDHQIEWLIGIRIVDDVRFGAANSRRKRRPVAAQAAQLYAGRIDQTHTIADFPPISSLQLSHQRREQSCEHFGGPQSIAGRERRPRYGAAPKMIKLVGMALQARFDLAQTSCAEKLGVQHRDQMRLGLQNSVIPIGIVLLHKMIESRPRDEFQNRMKDDILVSHGLGPFSCPVDSQVTGIE